MKSVPIMILGSLQAHASRQLIDNADEYIKSVEQKPFKKCAYESDVCCMSVGCVRHKAYKVGDETIHPNPCDGHLVCEWLIDEREDGCNTINYER